ncbi:uncharacterized protein LOC144167709 [Haemaphysalis longicornis]
MPRRLLLHLVFVSSVLVVGSCVAGTRLVTTADLSSGRPLRRARRQSRFICKSNDSFTKVMGSVIEANREVIRATAPLYVGDSENLGLVRLLNGRVYNLHTIKVREKFSSECNETTMNLVFKLRLDEPWVLFDLSVPLGGAAFSGGQLAVRVDGLDLDIGLVTPKFRGREDSGEPQVTFVDVVRAHKLRLEFMGMAPATTALTSALALLHRFLPAVQTRLFQIILIRILRKYVATTPLAF